MTAVVPSTVFLDVRDTVIDALGLTVPAATLDATTPLLGHIPELDSMGVVLLLTALEARFGLELSDDDIDSEWFQTLGSLTDAIEARIPHIH